ncbi:antibiotic biosynthesis monooxygenase [Gracilibacillus sp. YIM 98692]|uniref:antibiotic biosynthesis monooxygenase family protein n=1 Tax=Gracilibacillus sp. YIM 98692 TaxID=2663532 RepID=UPI0013D52016|nr:antibiotic biosynthesis monooxygenase [Gracilibacillus sp. YIM 98692]
MNGYMTNGTYDFLEKLKEKHPSYDIMVMQQSDKSIAYYEDAKPSIFQTSRNYEIVIQKGTFSKEGFVVLNHLPVTDEGRPIIEMQFKKRSKNIENTAGFQAFRLLRPNRGNTYVVMVQWYDKESYITWKNSSSFKQSHSKKEKPSYLAGPSYSETFVMKEKEEE